MCKKLSHKLLIDAKAAAQRMQGMIELTNQAVGDALSDLLLVETVLRARGWSAADWEACYTDLPNRLLKVTIKVRVSLIYKICHFLRLLHTTWIFQLT